MPILRSDVVDLQNRLAVERRIRNITQQELAEAIGITQAHLSYIESCKRDLTPQRYVMIKEYFNERDGIS